MEQGRLVESGDIEYAFVARKQGTIEPCKAQSIDTVTSQVSSDPLIRQSSKELIEHLEASVGYRAGEWSSLR